MKRIYLAPETRHLRLFAYRLMAGSGNPTPPTGYYYDDNGNLVPIPTDDDDDDPSKTSRFMRTDMWED